ncbi:hypothetical protein MJL48_29210, partial [Salmonella enterica subsp. enterica serovar Kentucky]|nr:hypothetical protein [Salmonella enterica subsp. enterica serovar Kentucky]
IQNHLLQILCMIAMSPPSDLSADSIRDEKVKVLKSLRRIDRSGRMLLTHVAFRPLIQQVAGKLVTSGIVHSQGARFGKIEVSGR